MMNVFITGATGFIGSYVCSQLVSKGYRVHGLKRRTSSIPNRLMDMPIQWFEGDILDVSSLQEAMAGCDAVYHCAGFVSLSNFEKKEMYRINIEGTANIVNVALEQRVRKMGYISSVAALDTMQQHIDETADFNAHERRDAYGLSKYYGELEVWRGIAEGLNAIVINPSIVLADDNWREGSGRFFGTVEKGLAYYPGGRTGFVDVIDVAACMIKLMESDLVNDKFIINSENLTYRDFLGRVAQALEKPQPSRMLRPWALELFWRASTFLSFLTRREPLVSRFSAKAAYREHHYLNNKIREAIQYEFMPIADSVQRQVDLRKQRF